MKVNSVNNISFGAFSTRAAQNMVNKAKSRGESGEYEVKLIQREAKNLRFHIDYRDGRFIVCHADETFDSYGDTTKRTVKFIPFEHGYSYTDPKDAADDADYLAWQYDVLYKDENYNPERALREDFILNYTI